MGEDILSGGSGLVYYLSLPFFSETFYSSLRQERVLLRGWKDRGKNIRGFNHLSILIDRDRPANPAAEIFTLPPLPSIWEPPFRSTTEIMFAHTSPSLPWPIDRTSPLLSSARSSGWPMDVLLDPRSSRSDGENSANTHLCVNSHSFNRLLQPFDGWYNYLARELTMRTEAAGLQTLLLKGFSCLFSVCFSVFRPIFLSFPFVFSPFLFVRLILLVIFRYFFIAFFSVPYFIILQALLVQRYMCICVRGILFIIVVLLYLLYHCCHAYQNFMYI